MKLPIFNCILLCLPLLAQAQNTLPEITLQPGMLITESCRIKPGLYRFDTPGTPLSADALHPSIRVAGNNITIDFQGAVLKSSADSTRPDLYNGLAVLATGQNIALKNLKIRGFKIGILLKEVKNGTIEDTDLSYNHRSRLYSDWNSEQDKDWLKMDNNEAQEWLQHGAGIYLWQCTGITVRNCTATANQNALLLSSANDCTLYNNTFMYNSGVGIGLYRSSNNRIMHNRLDWNVRGYTWNRYARGYESAALLCFEQSANNIFAYNSCTHSGTGLYLWAGQSTLDSGAGGSNDNTIFGNNFSYAATNGVEATFSRNRISGNLIKDCTYGIWAGYSFDTEISGNWLAGCQAAVAIEHGQNNTLRQNLFSDNVSAILFWERSTQPAEWAYPKKRDVRSKNALIDRNVFQNNKKIFKIGSSKHININGENLFTGFEQLLETPQPNDSLLFLRNDVYAPQAGIDAIWANPALAASRNLNFSHPHPEAPANPYAPLEVPVLELREPDSLPDGRVAMLPPGFPEGRQYIIMDEWGPFNFKRPIAAIDFLSKNKKNLDFTLLGPSGDFKVIGTRGVEGLSHRKGQVPQAIKAILSPDVQEVWIQFEYNGPETITTLHGNLVPPGQTYIFELRLPVEQ